MSLIAMAAHKPKRDTRSQRTEKAHARRPTAFGVAVAGALAIAVAVGFVLRSSPSTQETTQTPAPATVQSLRVDVIRRIPHDTTAFTQGLVWHEDRLYESTGERGKSTLRRVHPDTGEVEMRQTIGAGYFGEGLALVDRRLIWITWQELKAFVFDIDTFQPVGTFEYTGEGWGLTYDGRRLIMSDGTDTLTFRDPQTFEPRGTLRVTLRGGSPGRLNELEWANGAVYANVWQQDVIVRIDPESGRVTHLIDADGLLPASVLSTVDVLNGIAFNPGTETFYMTGKWWPTMFEVRFVP